MNRSKSIIFGAIIVIIGVLFLLKNFDIVFFRINIFDLGYWISSFWPTIFLIIPGVAVHTIFFSGKNKDAGILVPAGIILFTGITCQISTSFNMWHLMWPGFIMAVAIGLFELYYFGKREKGLLIPVGILAVLSLTFFTSFSLGNIFDYRMRQLFIPLILIVLGLVIMFKGRFRKGNY